ncbi:MULTISPECIES: hypothetical protein [unclassified Chamaesiphon]|uniref:hypothetical protein n=1 Tax=unclassified Chamaesiphon TaxID=2620921 RepID=UPI00286D274A|nr:MULTISPECIES: hypothetical protein [unclassified Chamaesiphon]
MFIWLIQASIFASGKVTAFKPNIHKAIDYLRNGDYTMRGNNGSRSTLVCILYSLPS